MNGKTVKLLKNYNRSGYKRAKDSYLKLNRHQRFVLKQFIRQAVENDFTNDLRGR